MKLRNKTAMSTKLVLTTMILGISVLAQAQSGHKHSKRLHLKPALLSDQALFSYKICGDLASEIVNDVTSEREIRIVLDEQRKTAPSVKESRAQYTSAVKSKKIQQSLGDDTASVVELKNARYLSFLPGSGNGIFVVQKMEESQCIDLIGTSDNIEKAEKLNIFDLGEITANKVDELKTKYVKTHARLADQDMYEQKFGAITNRTNVNVSNDSESFIAHESVADGSSVK